MQGEAQKAVEMPEIRDGPVLFPSAAWNDDLIEVLRDTNADVVGRILVSISKAEILGSSLQHRAPLHAQCVVCRGTTQNLIS